jgi:hypothetical protein
MSIRLALIIGLLAASSAAFGQIYRTVDANGNVVFTDIAPVDRSGGAAPPRAITVEPVNTFQPPVQAAPANTPETSTATVYYSELVVISPAEDATIRDNAGNIQIEVAITPSLRSDHRLLLVLDGQPTEVEAENGVFELSNVDRGTHTAGARAVDRQGNVLVESSPTTFNLMRVAVPQSIGPGVPTPAPR